MTVNKISNKKIRNLSNIDDINIKSNISCIIKAICFLP